MENPDRPEPVPQAQPSHCPDCNPRAHNHVHPGRYRDHCSVCHYLEGLEKEDPRLLASSTVRPVDQHGGHCQRCHTVREESGHTTIQPNCPGCYPKTPTPARHVDQHGFGPWPSSEQIEAHEARGGRWLVKADDSLQIGHFARLPVSQEVGFVIAGQWMSREGCCWTFCPVDEHGDKLDAAPVLRGEDARRLIESLAQTAPPPAPPVAPEAGLQPQLAVEPEIDAAGFGPWPSEDRMREHEARGGRWLAQEVVEPQPGQLRGLVLGRFLGGTWRSGGCDFGRAMMAGWSFCPIDDNGDKLDAAPVLRGEDARRLVESLGEVAPPEEIARRRAEARERLAANSRVELPQRPNPVTQRILSTLPARSPDRRILVVLRGLPGSGKSTVAQAIVDSDPARWARVSKDDLRQMMVGPNGDLFRFVEDHRREQAVAGAAKDMAYWLMCRGLDVVIDATNLSESSLASWKKVVEVVVKDSASKLVLVCERPIEATVEECCARDSKRLGYRQVGRAVIERLAATIDAAMVDRDYEVGP